MRTEIGDHFHKWLRVGTGCGFAASFATTGRVAYEAHDEMPPVNEVDANLDAYGNSDLSAVLIFPFVTSEESLIEVLHNLRAASPRWKLRDRGLSPTGTTLVGVDWQTTNGDICSTMGFAPLLTMPVPRRAPYVAIGAWPGGRANGERGIPPTPKPKAREVSFLDAKHSLGHEDYAALWTSTSTTVANLMIIPADNPGLYRYVAFALSANARDQITFDP